VGQAPGSISELARRLELDKAVVSRLVGDAEAGGWLVRRDAIVGLGPRAAALGRSSQAREFERLAAELAHAIAGVTGLDAMVVQFAGERGHTLAYAPGLTSVVSEMQVDPFPLFATAAGLTMAAALDDADLERRLAAPLTRYTDRTVVDPAALRERIDAARQGILLREDGEYAAGVGCFAAAWSHPLAIAPTSLAVLGPASLIAADEELIRRAIEAAVQPNATRATVVAAASRPEAG